jgi:cysteine desulfurase
MFSKRVYLDYASTTPVDKKVLKKMSPFFSTYFYNPQGLYDSSLKVKRVLEESRSEVARICGVKSEEVIFTSSGTESNNLAILGLIKAFKNNNPKIKPKIITTEIEHASILEIMKFLETDGVDVVYLKTLPNGQIDIEEFRKSLDERVVLISIMLANNEIGNILPVKKIDSEIKKFKNKIGRNHFDFPYLHSDASQAPCFLDINVNSVGVHLMTIDGSKIYGPKGVGILVRKNFVPIENILFGGNQEFGLRPGTENAALIIGFAEALKIAEKNRKADSVRLIALRDYFIEQLLQKFPNIKINGDLENRLPNNVNICVPGLLAEFAVIKLDLLGVECSSVTACKNISDETRSYVVDALGENCGASSLRLTLGRQTKKGDIDFVLKKLEKVITTTQK